MSRCALADDAGKVWQFGVRISQVRLPEDNSRGHRAVIDPSLAAVYAADMAQLADLLQKIDEAKAQLDALRPLDREREARVMQKFRLWWTYHSNAIEGNKLTQGETETFLMEGLTAKGKPLKDHLDLKGHSNAINYLLEFIRGEQPLTEVDIRNLHKILLVEPYEVDAITPDGKPTKKTVVVGEYKKSANHVRTRTGEIHYYAKPEETAAKMHDLMSWYREETTRGTTPLVEIVALFHHRFTAVHPFDDGNGRMSRLLMNLLLMQRGYPPVVLRLSEREEYLAALRSADRSENDDFVLLIAEHVLESLQLFIKAAQGIDVSEPTDLKKEIELEVVRFKHIEEPVPRTQQGVKELMERSLPRIVQEIIQLLGPFSELFTKSELAVNSTLSQRESRNATMPLVHFNVPGYLQDCFPNAAYPLNSRIQVNFLGFKKGGFDTFDLTTSILIDYEPYHYHFTVHTSGAGSTTQHFYQEQLTHEEIITAVEKMAQYCLHTIRAKTKV